MASRETIVEELMQELGKDSPALRAQIRDKVGEITIDLLSQNEGEFHLLQMDQDITLDVSTDRHLLNRDFKKAMKDCIIVDSVGAFIGKFDIVSPREFNIRKANSTDYPGALYGKIKYLPDETTGAGFYLILGTTPTEVSYLQFMYFRVPTEEDTDIISNPMAVKEGVRMHLAAMKPEWQASTQVYFGMRAHFGDKLEDVTTKLVMRPPRNKGNFNRKMHDIGRGN